MGPIETNTYFLEIDDELIIIDPAGKEDKVIELIGNKKLVEEEDIIEKKEGRERTILRPAKDSVEIVISLWYNPTNRFFNFWRDFKYAKYCFG